uniref:Uncharacterized protein n=1 Tax=Trypanosoma vivax (strain Y486) TaxID=1055687 RepID=G0TZ19_TRYVY|nr:conserved hypothetical protein [Trypanosoma vivax Y486]
MSTASFTADDETQQLYSRTPVLPPAFSFPSLPPLQRTSHATAGADSGEVTPGGFRQLRPGCSGVPASVELDGAQGSSRRRHKKRDSGAYDPSVYSTLLPATVKLRKVGGMRGGPVVGVAAEEMLASREARFVLCGLLRPLKGNAQLAPPQDQKQFKARVHLLQERGRRFLRRFRRHAMGRGAADSDAMMIIDGSDDGSSDGEMGEVLHGDAIGSVRKQREHERRTGVARAASVARKRRLNELRYARGPCTLRAEIKRSTRAVRMARNNVSCDPGVLPALSEKQQELLGRGSDWRAPEGDLLSFEGVCWDAAEGVGLPGSVLPSGCAQGPLSNAEGSKATVASRHVSAMLRDLLRHSRGAVSYGILPPRMGRRAVTRVSHPTDSEFVQPSLPLDAASDMGSSRVSLSRWQSPRTVPEHVGVREPKRPNRRLPIKWGVGERAKEDYDALVEEQRLVEMELNLRHNEGLGYTCRQLNSLLPERRRQLECVLAQPHENPRMFLLKHRREIFRRVVEADAEGRRQARSAFLDVLEDFCQAEMAADAWSVMSKALEQTRAFIHTSPARYCPQGFDAIVNGCFSLNHIQNKTTYNALQWLAQLYDVPHSQFKSVMSAVHNRLSQPRDYEARFREIDRSLGGVTAPADRWVRVHLHRCRFQLPAPATCSPQVGCIGGGNGSGAGGCNVVSSCGMERPEVCVQLMAKGEAAFSTTVCARLDTTDIDDTHTAVRYAANLQDEVVRLKAPETGIVDVSLLCNGTPLCTGALNVAKCSLLSRRLVPMWLRLSNKHAFVANIRLTLEFGSEKERRRRYAFG